MGMAGDKIGFHPHLSFHGGGQRGIPKGCVAVTVGQGAEQQRFVIPVMYINHPLFVDLLREAEEEHGFRHDGPINIPCRVEEFRHVRGVIDTETTSSYPSHRRHEHDQNHRQFLCFKA